MSTVDTTVLVTGVGAIIGQGIVDGLRRSGRSVRVVGLDRNPDCLGPKLCDDFVPKPSVAEQKPAYLEFWNQILTEYQVDLVLPGIEEDVFFLDANRAALSAHAVLGINRPDVIAYSRDKWRLYEIAGEALIPTTLSEDWTECESALGPMPWLMKPRQGSGSRGIVQLEDRTAFDYWTTQPGGDRMIQRIVGTSEQEYTVGVFGLGEGQALDEMLIFRRRLSPEGNTHYVERVNDEAICAEVRRLVATLQPVGPTNFQFRKEGDAVFLLEVNPRFSSSASLRTAFGFNEARMALEFFVDGQSPVVPSLRYGRGWRQAGDHVELSDEPQ